MTTIKPLKPMKLEGNLSKKWLKWKTNFLIFMQASNLEVQPSKTKTKVLLHLIGQPVRDIHQSFDLTKKQRRDFQTTIEKFDEYFSCVNNPLTIYRYQLFTARQEQSETFDEFYTRLKMLSGKCELATLEESLLKDLLILGLKDGRLQKKLLSRKDISLKTVVKHGRLIDNDNTKNSSLKSDRRNRIDENGTVGNCYIGDNRKTSSRKNYKNQTVVKDSSYNGDTIKASTSKIDNSIVQHNIRNDNPYNGDNTYNGDNPYNGDNIEPSTSKSDGILKHNKHGISNYSGDNDIKSRNSRNTKSVQRHSLDDLETKKLHIKEQKHVNYNDTENSCPLYSMIDESICDIRLLGSNDNLRTKFKKLSYCRKNIKTSMLDQIDGVKKKNAPLRHSDENVIARRQKENIVTAGSASIKLFPSNKNKKLDITLPFNPHVTNNNSQVINNNYHDIGAQRDTSRDSTTRTQTPGCNRKLIFAAMNYSSGYFSQQKCAETTLEQSALFTGKEKVLVTATSSVANDDKSVKNREVKDGKQKDSPIKRESVSSASLQIKLYKMI